MPSIKRIISLIGSAPALSLVALLLAGCSGGGGTTTTSGGTQPTAGCDTTTGAGCGTVLVALTDAEGDFSAYTVDVESISLKRADGASVEALPASTRVDFAQLTSLSDIVAAATLAPGDISGGTIRIDYSNAEIYVEAGGQIVPAAVIDEAGEPLGVVDVEISLDDRDHLLVTRNRTHLLQIDFDLEASHEVDTSTNPATVVARPVLIAEVRPVDEKEIRVRGALVDVDIESASYEVRVRPWHSPIGDHGAVTVQTTDSTAFEIDGQPFTGQPGIEALADKARGTLTVAFGTLDVADRSFTAEIVHAGTSVGGGDLSAIHGNIVSRTGDSLVVKGATAVRGDRLTHFHRTVIVEVGPETGVTRLSDRNADFDEDDLSVGQRIVAFGELTNPGISTDPLAPDVALVLDATAGRVRMLPTRLHGTVTTVVPGQINLNLRGIDRLGIDLFDFTGTGMTPLTDADPTDYEVATSSLPLDAIEIDRPVRVIGFVNRFGAAPPDFEGRTLVGPRELRAALGIGWMAEGTPAPFLVMSAASLVPDLANPSIGERHHMLIGDRLIDLFDLAAAPSIEPAGATGVYSIAEPGHVEIFADFGDFVDELGVRLGGNSNARALAAYGQYAEDANALPANRVIVHMVDRE